MAFVLSVNGKHVCSVSVGKEATRSINLTLIGGNTDADDVMFLTYVMGTEGSERLEWELPELEAGDEITIKLTDVEKETPPTSRKLHERSVRSAE